MSNPESSDGKSPRQNRYVNASKPTDATMLHDLFESMVICGNPKIRERKQVESMLRYAAPYSSDQMKALGMEHMPNFTMGEMPRRVAEEERKWTDFITSSTGICAVELDIPGSNEDLAVVEGKASLAINESWANFVHHAIAQQIALKQHAAFGAGYLFWLDPNNPSPEAKISSKVRFPSDTRIDMVNFSECAIRDEWSAQKAYDAYKRQSKIKNTGWESAALLKVLRPHLTEGGKPINNDRAKGIGDEEMEQRLGRGELGFNATKSASPINITHFFIKEYTPDDKGNWISQITIAETSEGDKIIRRKDRIYASPRNFCVIATNGVGLDGTIAGLRGLGMNIRAHCEAIDIMANTEMHTSILASLPRYTGASSAAAEMAEKIVVRPNGILMTTGIQETQGYVSSIAAANAGDRLQTSTDRQQSIYSQNAPGRSDNVTRTAKEAGLDFAKQQQTNSSEILLMRTLFFEPLMKEFARRLIQFPVQKSGNQAGQPEKLPGREVVLFFLKKASSLEIDVAAIAPYANVISNPYNTPGGLDRIMMESDMLQEVLPLLQTQPQRNAIINRKLTGVLGYRAAKPILNTNEESTAPNVRDNIEGENADMASGVPRTAHPEQDHLIHLSGPGGTGHLAILNNAMQAISAESQSAFDVDPDVGFTDKVKALAAILTHCEEHLFYASQNPVTAQAADAVFEILAEGKRVLNEAVAQVQKIAQANAEASGVDPKVQAKLQESNAKIQVMQQESQAKLQLEERKSITKLGQMQATFDSRQRLKEIDHLASQNRSEVEDAKERALKLSRESSTVPNGS